MSTASPLSPPPQRRAPRWLWIGFFVCLTLNLLVLGWAIGAAWHFHRTREFRSAGAPYRFGAFVRHLSATRRAEFHTLMREASPSLSPLQEAVRTARRAAEEAMAQEPFEREAFAAANRKLHMARAALSARRSEIFTRILAAMTPEERRLFLQLRSKSGERWRRWHAAEE